ncbi:MAG: hypothetical protein GX180_13745 [Enterococcus sp.]|nr:hypothetical protein [Enterococcus sp.]
MESSIVKVLGTTYKVTIASKEDLPKRFDDCDGEIDESIKEIYVNNQQDLIGNIHALQNRTFLINKNIRHELIHAFLFESGLAENSYWAQNEEMVDWVARQFPKMLQAFKELNAI